MVDEALVQEIVQNFDLLAEVEKLVTLRKQGRFYVGPCPICGGNDRFNLMETANGWRWHCRHCHGGKYFNPIHMMEALWKLEFADTVQRMSEGRQVLTEAERLEIAIERARRAQEELAAAQQAAEERLTELRNAQAWVHYHDNLDGGYAARQLWDYRGVPGFWQDWWQLGYDPKHTIWTKETGEWASPTITFPVFAPGWEIRQVKHRLLSPPPKGGKYWTEQKGLPPIGWISDPDHPISGPVFVTEGEIKAMVTAVTYDDERVMFFGLPGKSPGMDVLAQLAEADPIYLCMDPDVTEDEVKRVVEALGGSRVRRIQLPMKIDDAILRYKLDKRYLIGLMAAARKVA